jgi:CheY-like chemotaxis protein
MGEQKRILVIDDDPRITDLLAEFCTNLGYEVIPVNDGLSAVAAVEAWKPDLITLDLEMPGKDGLEVLRELRAHPETRNIPVLVISIVAREAKILPDEVQGVFDKPIRFQELLSEIDRLLQQPAAQ